MGRKPTATPMEVAALADSMCSQKELASVLGISEQAVSQMLQKPAYREAWDRARNDTRIKLRRAQIESALNGDRTLLIWTGKQYLDQRDSPRELDVKTDVQVTYIARWGGEPSLPAPPDPAIIEGEVEEDE